MLPAVLFATPLLGEEDDRVTARRQLGVHVRPEEPPIATAPLGVCRTLALATLAKTAITDHLEVLVVGQLLQRPVVERLVVLSYQEQASSHRCPG